MSDLKRIEEKHSEEANAEAARQASREINAGAIGSPLEVGIIRYAMNEHSRDVVKLARALDAFTELGHQDNHPPDYQPTCVVCVAERVLHEVAGEKP